MSTVGFVSTGDRLVHKLKIRYMEAVLKQDIAYFDQQGAGHLTTVFSANIDLIHDAISLKLGQALSALGTLGGVAFVMLYSNWIIAFMLSWAICLPVGLLLLGNRISSKYDTKALNVYASAGDFVEEVFGSIRTVLALGMQHAIEKRYLQSLQLSQRNGLYVKCFQSVALAIAIGVGYLGIALALWQGSRYLVADEVIFSKVVILSISAFQLAFAIFSIGANFEAFVAAIPATADLFTVIERRSTIDPTDLYGVVPDVGSGMIELQDVRHNFPTRPDVVITDGLNISFSPNQTTVLVGATGSGKSSIGHLLVRFYDPLRGKILLDGHDIRSVNVRWLRRHVRLLGQDPVLFDTPIFENIRHGLIGTEYESLSDSDEKLAHIIEQAARKACVHDFITSLPLGYRTLVGGRGLKLSGGQRQRIALARALVADPKILILDEATSALDNETEAKVLRALVSDSQSRTTIVVAHRLSAVCDAGTIVVLDHGIVLETGTHVALMSNNGIYKHLFEAQNQEIRPWSEPNGLGQTCIAPIRSSIEGQQEMEKSETCITTDSIIGSARDGEEAEDTTSSQVSALSLLLFVLRLSQAEFYPLLIGTVCSIIAGFEECCGRPFQQCLYSALTPIR